MKIRPSAILFAFLVSFLSFVISPAAAQWMWKDEKNQTVISDQPPPKTIPLQNILKTPRGSSLTPRAIKSATDEPGTDPAKDGAKKDEGPKTYAEKDLDYKKRQKEAAEASQKQAEEASKAKAMQERCKTLRNNMAGYDSGIRIARINEKGEREFLDDKQRQADSSQTRSELAKDCK